MSAKEKYMTNGTGQKNKNSYVAKKECVEEKMNKTTTFDPMYVDVCKGTYNYLKNDTRQLVDNKDSVLLVKLRNASKQ